MNRTILTFLILSVVSTVSTVSAQIEGVTRKAQTIERRPIQTPPQLALVPGSLHFEDANENGILDHGEEATVSYSVRNDAAALGAAKGLVCEIQLKGVTSGIDVPESIRLADIPIGGMMQYAIPIRAQKTKDGILELQMKVKEPLGFGLPSQSIEITTQQFRQPNVRITDTRVRERKIERGQTFTYDYIVANTGEGYAYDVRCELELPDDGVLLVGGEPFKADMLRPGEQRALSAQIVSTADYPHDKIQVKVVVVESEGKYGEDFLADLEVDSELAQSTFSIPVQEMGTSGSIGLFGSDVDRNIPMGKKSNANRFALVIGNQDYSSQNAGMLAAQNVPFADVDAEIMREYLIKLWGVPEDQVQLLTNGTGSQMKQALKQISESAKFKKGEAELIFYYSGHGLPAEGDNEPYLIPVDVDGSDPELGVALKEVFASLEEYPTERITIFLDACFSGGARDASLLADSKGIYREPEAVEVKGKSVVFASSSGTEPSGVYREKKHGYFTYFLLQVMQEKGEKLTYGELFDELYERVGTQSSKDRKTQTPEVSVAPGMGEGWKEWKIND